MSPKIIGIVNVTPDSFSDGGEFFSADAAILHAKKLLAEGADIIDIGGDSTRPGSNCVGAQEEWRRIQPVVQELAQYCPVSVDTHHAIVAAKALECGAKFINDISSGSDPQMFEVVAGSNSNLILMYSRCSAPHVFRPAPSGDIIDQIQKYLTEKIDLAIKRNVPRGRIILDPGMGGFLSDESNVSWQVISRFNELSNLGSPLCFASSRKGFLRTPHEASAKDRDPTSALTAIMAWQACPQSLQYVRTHNVTMTKEFFECAAKTSR